MPARALGVIINVSEDGVLLEYIEQLGTLRSLQDVWSLHCDTMAGFEFDRLLYGFTRFRTDDGYGDLRDAIYLSNHAPEYVERFVIDGMFAKSPMFVWAVANVGACSWATYWDEPEKLSPTQLEIVRFNRAMGVTAGYTISFAEPSPRTAGGIALCAAEGLSQADVDEIWARSGRVIMALNSVAHMKMTALPHHEVIQTKLSARQREVLKWVGEGKSHQDIATILDVSVATVEKHLRLARERLGVETTAQAVLKASFQNQIYMI